MSLYVLTYSRTILSLRYSYSGVYRLSIAAIVIVKGTDYRKSKNLIFACLHGTYTTTTLFTTHIEGARTRNERTTMEKKYNLNQGNNSASRTRASRVPIQWGKSMYYKNSTQVAFRSSCPLIFSTTIKLFFINIYLGDFMKRLLF